MRVPTLPILGWIRGYDRAWLRLDVLAGITVLALLVPEGMAYAQLAGMPPQAAFYAAPIGLLLYAILGTSRQLVVAVSSTVAVLSAAAVGALGPADAVQYAALTGALAIIAGSLSILAGLLRAGRLARFFSESVLVGFVFGLALVIAVKQVPKILGIPGGGEDFFERVWIIAGQLPQVHLPTAAVGITALAVLIVLERRFERIPAALVVLVGGIAASALLGLEARQVEVVGAIPGGLAPPRIPAVSLQDLALLLPAAAGITLINFAEAYGPARTFAAAHELRVDADQELVALGAANVGAGLMQGFAIGASLSKSAANDRAGAKSPLSLIVAAAATLGVALFLTPLFGPLPEAVLGAIVIVAVSGMMKVGVVRRLWTLNRPDAWLALVALLGVLVLDVELGLVVAIVMSLGALVWRTSLGPVSVLEEDPTTGRFRVRHGAAATAPDADPLVLRPDEPLAFVNADGVHDRVVAMASSGGHVPGRVVLDLEASATLDVPSLDMLAELAAELARLGSELTLARTHAPVRELLAAAGLTEDGGGRIAVHDRVADAATPVARSPRERPQP
jgi:SulP family sulfate permease